MRILTFILAAYTLAISLSPCSDRAELLPCIKDQASLEHNHPELQTAKDNCEDHADNCSPFCSCTCCSIAMECEIIYPPSTYPFSENSSGLVHLSKFGNPSSIALSVWQPPKLV